AHACVLHWIRNDGAIDPNALLLLDAGVETDTVRAPRTPHPATVVAGRRRCRAAHRAGAVRGGGRVEVWPPGP
ncbi:hypothetical protein ACWC5I_40645, partial [Kitasatospora sp. NPDC001574]